MARSPKLGPAASPHWYGYYAGYSADFVSDVLEEVGVSETDVVLDPWNGSGTTTGIASAMGVRAHGFDLNPAMVLVARARLLDASVVDSLAALTEELVERANEAEAFVLDPEPLGAWMSPASCAHVRRLERAIQRVLIDHDSYEVLAKTERLESVSSLAALYYVALFEVVKGLIQRFRPTNPAWMKFPDSPRARIRPSQDTIQTEFRDAVDRLAAGVRTQMSDVARGYVNVAKADSKALPLDDGSITVTLTSPPYCTRIDYVVTTLGELAVMGYRPDGPEIASLRNAMLGTPTIDRKQDLDELSGEAAATLQRIERHRSVASATYYRRCFEQYFSQLLASLREIRRVTAPQGTCGIVVQDSYYKDIHVDLQAIVVDLAGACDWRLERRSDFDVPHTKAAMNPRARAYRQSFDAIESLLVFKPAKA
jgi:SAM-dependent methyltransferase